MMARGRAKLSRAFVASPPFDEGLGAALKGTKGTNMTESPEGKHGTEAEYTDGSVGREANHRARDARAPLKLSDGPVISTFIRRLWHIPEQTENLPSVFRHDFFRRGWTAACG